jgi:site-specific recombinase XerD
MLDIYSRVSILAGETIPDIKKREGFLRQFSLILKDYNITEISTELAVYDHSDIELCKMFLGIKAVEGCTKGTLLNYSESLRMLRAIIQKPLNTATANDIRCALAVGMTKRSWSATTANNYRRNWSSFYTWAFNERQIEDNPMRQVKAIKGKRNVRMPFSEEEMEKLRNATNDIRERAILEFFFSTACRVSEVAGLNLSDIDFPEHTAKVLGKGQKERIVYLNAKAMLYLKQYIETRTDDCAAVFIAKTFNSKKHPRPLAISGLEIIMRDLGKRAGVHNVHPHRFRHTAATYALRRGMPIEQVQQMLGHEKIDTTLIYAKINNDSLKANHHKYLN